ncbi:MAG: hypothetical protein F4X35_00170 [Alphaproteobacteria bacterium]|nr:hypothetical protein [Alphaproteobacteria bacterium]
MPEQTNRNRAADGYTAAAVAALLVLTGAMLLAMFTRTEPHPPLEVEPFALGPFLAASLATGAAAYALAVRGARFAMAVALLFALTALVSYGPQKYVDPAFPRIWPAVIVAQVAIAGILWQAVCRAVGRMRSTGRSRA